MLQTISKKQIFNELKQNELEDLDLLKNTERLLVKKRGYIFKIPPQKTPVISFMSGGLDTTTVTAILLEEYKLTVYPVFFNRHIENSKKVKKSVEFFADYFGQKYPDSFKPLQILDLKFPPKQIEEVILLTDSDNTKLKRHSHQRRGIPFQPSLYMYHSLIYSYYLAETQNTQIKTIFGSWLKSNGFWHVYETLTSLRLLMLELCLMTKDFTWQFTSLPIEKELGFFYGKDFLIKWGFHHKLPLEKTWTCLHNKSVQCGQCSTCLGRQRGFSSAGIIDKTKYAKTFII